FGKLKSDIITVHVNGKQEKLRLPEGFGVLQGQNGPANSFGSFLGRQLAEIIATKERILITANGMMDLHQNFYNPKIHTKDHAVSLARTKPTGLSTGEDGYSALSKNLMVKVYGSLVAPGNKSSLTSPYDDLTVIYLMPGVAGERTTSHELFGHTALAVRGKP